jgi:hypothetical protein
VNALNPDQIGELLQRHQAGSKAEQHEAVRELHQQVADHLAGSGSIPDMRLRCWAIDHHTQQAQVQPQTPGRPSGDSAKLEIALQVEKLRARGVSKTTAIIHVVESSKLSENTVEQYHKIFRAAAKRQIKRRAERIGSK